MTARSDSASIRSPTLVEAAASQNTTVTVLRLSWTAPSGRSWLPQLEQKRADPAFSGQQLGQAITREVYVVGMRSPPERPGATRRIGFEIGALVTFPHALAGVWPSGKAPDSGSGDRRFESFRPSQTHKMWDSCSREHHPWCCLGPSWSSPRRTQHG